MKGVGYCCVLISWYVSFYYNVIIGWTLFFIFTTLTSGKMRRPLQDGVMDCHESSRR